MTEARLSTTAQARLDAIETSPTEFEMGYNLGRLIVKDGYEEPEVYEPFHALDGSIYAGIIFGIHVHLAEKRFTEKLSQEALNV